jgi:hypothetical protein
MYSASWKSLADVFELHITKDLKTSIAKASGQNESLALPCLSDVFAQDTAVAFLEHHGGRAVVDVIRAYAVIEKAKPGEDGLLDVQTEAVKMLSECRF